MHNGSTYKRILDWEWWNAKSSYRELSCTIETKVQIPNPRAIT